MTRRHMKQRWLSKYDVGLIMVQTWGIVDAPIRNNGPFFSRMLVSTHAYFATKFEIELGIPVRNNEPFFSRMIAKY